MMDFDLVPPSMDLMVSISDRAGRPPISIYDSSYFAEPLATNLVTVDKRLRQCRGIKGEA